MNGCSTWGKKRPLLAAEYWYSGGVLRFEDANNSGLYYDVTVSGGPESHFTLGEQGYNWANVPLIWPRYNDEESAVASAM